LNSLSFEIYEHINSGFSKEEISKKFNVPIWVVENLEKMILLKNWMRNLKNSMILYKNFIFDEEIISKEK